MDEIETIKRHHGGQESMIGREAHGMEVETWHCVIDCGWWLSMKSVLGKNMCAPILQTNTVPSDQVACHRCHRGGLEQPATGLGASLSWRMSRTKRAGRPSRFSVVRALNNDVCWLTFPALCRLPGLAMTSMHHTPTPTPHALLWLEPASVLLIVGNSTVRGCAI